MSAAIEVKVPDIGDFTDIPVIEVLVKVGDTIKLDESLVTLESDKATMDVPSSAAGVVTAVLLKVGDKVSEGTLVAMVEAVGVAAPDGADKTTAAETIALPGGRPKDALLAVADGEIGRAHV